MWHDAEHEPKFSEYLELDLGDVVPSIAGPEASAGPDPAVRREDRVPQGHSQLRRGEHARRDTKLDEAVDESFPASDPACCPSPTTTPSCALGGRRLRTAGRASRSTSNPTSRGEFVLDHGAVVIAAITSCTNTSNPSVMLGAALLARNAVEKGLTSKPWVKTTMAPGSQVVTDYYEKAGLWPYLEKLGFYLVGYGCTTCIGNYRPAAGGDLQGDQRRRPDGHRGALGQPQLRGPHLPRREDELPGLPAAGHRLRAGRHHGLRLRDRAARPGRRRQRRLPEGHLAVVEGDPRHHRVLDQPGDVRRELRRRVQGRRALAQPAHAGGQDLRVGPELDLRPQAAVLRRHARRAGAGHRHHGRQSACAAWRFGDHRPHLARRQHQGGHARPRSTSTSTASTRRTTTPTARGAATTR